MLLFAIEVRWTSEKKYKFVGWMYVDSVDQLTPLYINLEVLLLIGSDVTIAKPPVSKNKWSLIAIVFMTFTGAKAMLGTSKKNIFPDESNPAIPLGWFFDAKNVSIVHVCWFVYSINLHDRLFDFLILNQLNYILILDCVNGGANIANSDTIVSICACVLLPIFEIFTWSIYLFSHLEE